MSHKYPEYPQEEVALGRSPLGIAVAQNRALNPNPAPPQSSVRAFQQNVEQWEARINAVAGRLALLWDEIEGRDHPTTGVAPAPRQVGSMNYSCLKDAAGGVYQALDRLEASCERLTFYPS